MRGVIIDCSLFSTCVFLLTGSVLSDALLIPGYPEIFIYRDVHTVACGIWCGVFAELEFVAISEGLYYSGREYSMIVTSERVDFLEQNLWHLLSLASL